MKKQNKFDNKFIARIERKFTSVIIRNSNQHIIEKIRNLLLPNKKYFNTNTEKGSRGLDNFLYNIRSKRNYKFYFSFLKKILNKIGLEKFYVNTLLSYICTNKVKFMSDFDIGEISSRKMRELFVREAEKEGIKIIKNKKLRQALKYNYRSNKGKNLYPVEIYLSPMVSQDEACAFIRNNWDDIESHQKLYGKKYYKPIKNLELYYLIDKYRSKGKTHKEIAEILNNSPAYKGGDFIDNDIAKLYSKWNKLTK